jgi:hypothetical protein
VWPVTPRLLRNAPKASWMTCAMHGMWFLNAGHSIPQSSSVDYSSCVIEWFEKALSVVSPSKQPLVSSNQSWTSFNCAARRGPFCGPLTNHPELAVKTGKAQAINLIKSELYFTQCPVSIHIVSNGQLYVKFVSWYPSVLS